MDELLALMDDDVASAGAEDEAVSVSSSIAEQAREPPAVRAAPNNSNNRQQSPPCASHSRLHPDLRRQRPFVEPQDNRVEASIDDKLGIYMIKRRMSSMDLIELLSIHAYHSPASLAAASLKALNRLLVSPTAVVSAATVCGKTSIVTVGIVFSNTGTRISSKGRAFSVLSIGNLRTGPVASVFMFGEAYSQHCAKCPEGTVVAVVTPNLLSPKPHDSSSSSSTLWQQDTIVSLSVADKRQLIPVAHARYYGKCKGTVSIKGPDGKWISHGARCNHYVDTRVSDYCNKHQRQGNVKSGSGGAVLKGKGNLTFVQKQRMEQQQQHGPAKFMLPNSTRGKGMMTLPHSSGSGTATIRTGTRGNPLPLPTPSDARQQQPNIEQEFEKYSQTSRRFGNAPMHMKQQNRPGQPQPQRSRSTNRFQRSSGAAATNTVNRQRPQPQQAMKKSKSSVVTPPTPNSKGASTDAGSSSKDNLPVPDDWLLNPKKGAAGTARSGQKQTHLIGKKRALNKDTIDFDGSVSVPKPSKLFRGQASTSTAHQHDQRTIDHHDDHQRALNQAKIDSVLQQQRLLAEQNQKENSQKSAWSVHHQAKVVATKPGGGRPATASSSDSADDVLKDSLFGQFGSMDTEQLLNAKSQFADEADAEEYAKCRRVMNDLERREEQMTRKAGKSQTSKKESAIQKEWICSTCNNRKTKTMPKMCIRAKHKVRFTRDVKKSDTVEERRLKQNEKSAEEGGLKLGAGLEWDPRRHMF